MKDGEPGAGALTDAFAAAMGAPPRPKEPAAPPDVDREAPHGRDADGKPIEKYGRNKDGSIRRSPAGRPSKDDKARTGPAPQSSDKKPGSASALAEPGQYARELADTAETIWFGLSALGKSGPNLPLVGRWLPGQKIQAQAAVWFATKDRAVAAVDLAAQHSASAARLAGKLSGGDVIWAITCMSLVAPILTLSGMVWASDADEQLAKAEQPSVQELAKRNEKAMDEAIARLTAQLEQAAAEQLASVNGQPPAGQEPAP